MYTPKNLKLWDTTDPACGTKDNYMGEHPTHCYIAPVSQTRDSGLLERNNFEEGGKIILPLCQHAESGITSFNHWACGWFELILIHESDEKALIAADILAKKLADYSIVNEDSYSRAEYEYVITRWEEASLGDRLDHLRSAMWNNPFNIFSIRSDYLPMENDYLWDYLREG